GVVAVAAPALVGGVAVAVDVDAARGERVEVRRARHGRERAIARLAVVHLEHQRGGRCRALGEAQDDHAAAAAAAVVRRDGRHRPRHARAGHALLGPHAAGGEEAPAAAGQAGRAALAAAAHAPGHGVAVGDVDAAEARAVGVDDPGRLDDDGVGADLEAPQP